MKFRLASFTTLLAALVVASPTRSAEPRFPEKPVKVVVAFAPGGNNDVPMRIVSAKLAELWGVPVNVENRAGAGGPGLAGEPRPLRGRRPCAGERLL